MPDTILPAIDVRDHDGLPLRWVVKSCSGAGSDTLRKWINGNEVLFLTDSRGKSPLVIVDFDAWERIARVVPLAPPRSELKSRQKKSEGDPTTSAASAKPPNEATPMGAAGQKKYCRAT